MGAWLRHIRQGPIPVSLLVTAVVVTLAVRLAPAVDARPDPRIYEAIGALQPAENVAAVVVGAYDSASVHHLLVTGAVAPHYHRLHDETVIIQAGQGTMRVGDETRDVSAGTVIVIPRGTVHSLEVTGDPVEAISVFSPRFDGEDRVFVDE